MWCCDTALQWPVESPSLQHCTNTSPQWPASLATRDSEVRKLYINKEFKFFIITVEFEINRLFNCCSDDIMCSGGNGVRTRPQQSLICRCYGHVGPSQGKGSYGTCSFRVVSASFL